MYEDLNYTALSMQMAGRSSKSICQLAIRVVENGKMIFCESYLIKPPDGLKFTFEDYHGITEKRVKDKPTLDLIWSEIEHHINGKNVLVYWLEKSQKWLENSLAVYKIPAPQCNYIDILDLLNENRERFSFKAIAKSIDFDDDFQPGNSRDNVQLFQAIIDNLIERRSKKVQEAFGIKLESRHRTNPKQTTKNPTSLNTATKNTGCLLPILLTLTLVFLLISYTV
ncbi:3'-5' exonuclease family protein [Anaerosinus massiliensis]|uniref:hypothetical protein n=1 Tax=Massilibacillus massiliensis TaxID=1806837 RepID=UPI000DA609AC|nr:hypothetical protein [Massilibacillus massiliensis]